MKNKSVTLKGITWNHDRGYNPMLVTSHVFSEKKLVDHQQDVFISWEKRSLQAFADRPLEKMADQFDLIVIDHPHVGSAASSGLLQGLDRQGYDDRLDLLSKESLGVSHTSYRFNGCQWALAIDAAAPVAAYRPDLLQDPPKKWEEVIDLADQGKVIWPLIPINSLMSYYNFLANIGKPFGGGGVGVDRATSIEVLKLMKRVSDRLPSRCFSMDPIDAYEWLSIRSTHSYVPFLFGYSNYSRSHYRPNLVKVTNIPCWGDQGPIGSPIGGTGIAISKFSRHLDVALEYAFWIASAECQKGIYYQSGGQPANIEAWRDQECNRTSHHFFRDTLDTLEQCYLRPRHLGYMNFQEIGGDLIYSYLTDKISASEVTERINQAYDRSLQHG